MPASAAASPARSGLGLSASVKDSIAVRAAAPRFPYGLGLIVKKSATPSARTVSSLKLSAESLPPSVDLTADAMPVGNQGQVGSCAAWATDYGALGYWENKQGIAGGALEPMYTYSQVTGGQDDGSTIEGNLQIDEQQGIDTQSDYWQGNFDYRDQPTAAEKANAANWKLTGYTDLAVVTSASSTTTQDSIEAALAAGDPVVIGIPVYTNFEELTSANNGYYAGASGSLLGGHAIVALGYDSTGLRIENSWTTSWGDSGFATLSWAFVNKDVDDAVSVGPLVDGQPLNTSAPVVTGNATVGQTLTVATGSWNPAATSYTYQWERAAQGSSTWTMISGATSATYVLPSTLTAYDIRALVSATDSAGSSSAPSAAVGPVSDVPANTVAPAITGTSRQGSTLTAGKGTWSPAGTTYTYQWQSSGDGGVTWSSITGATKTTYVPGTGDLGNELDVVVTAADKYGHASAASTATGAVASGAPVNTVAPAISGTVRQGSTLRVANGTWSPAGTTYTYQWQSSSDGGVTWSPITGATKATYVPGIADLASTLNVIVTATNKYGVASATTAASVAVGSDAPADTVAPAISGTAARGSTMTATRGTWSPAGTAYAYQWQGSTDSGVTWSPITGATTAKYTLASTDEQSEVRVAVTATNLYGSTTATSQPSKTVASSPPVDKSVPTISGSAQVGGTLSATTGTWTGVGNTYSYQWEGSSGTGSSTVWSPITGATASTYSPQASDQGTTLKVVVTATNTDSSSGVSATSKASAKIAA